MEIVWTILGIMAWLAVIGGIAYLVFAWIRRGRTTEVDAGIGVPRRFYFYSISFIALMMLASGVMITFSTLLDGLAGDRVVLRSETTKLASGLALSCKCLQPGNDRNHDLQNNAGRDVGIHAHRGDGQVPHRAAAEDVQESQQLVALEELPQRDEVRAGYRNVRDKPENNENREREENAASQIRLVPGVDHRLDQRGARLPTFCRR